MLAFTSDVPPDSGPTVEEFLISPERRPATGAAPAPTAARPQDPYLMMLKGAFWPTLIVGVVCTVSAWFLAGGPGLAGALIAVVTVLVFFATSLLVMSRTAQIAPINVMAVGVLTYVTKVGLLGLLFLLLKDASWMSGDAFAMTALICAAVWMPMEIWAYGRARILVFDETPQKETADG